MISDVSVSADMIIALPSRSSSFSNRSKSASSSGVISSTTSGNRHGKHDAVLRPRLLRQVLEEVVELAGQAALPVPSGSRS